MTNIEDSIFFKFEPHRNDCQEHGQGYWVLPVLGIGIFEKIDLSGLTGKTIYGKPTDFETEMAMVKLGAIGIELIQPVNDAPLFEEFLENNGEGINHIA